MIDMARRHENRGVPLNINGALPCKYAEWIRRFVDGDGYGLCAEFANHMKNEFPELELVSGYVGTTGNYHVWCRLDKLIVDPTAAQFASVMDRKPRERAKLYHQRKVYTKVRRGCPRCGNPVYVDGIMRCSTYCHIDELRYMSQIVVNYCGGEVWKGLLVGTRLRYDEQLGGCSRTCTYSVSMACGAGSRQSP